MNTKGAILIALALLKGAKPQAAQTSAPSPAEKKNKDVVDLSPIAVRAEEVNGYVATKTMAGTRIRTDLKDVASAISVGTKEFMRGHVREPAHAVRHRARPQPCLSA